jgi:carotenoid cleavage dioxygenase
MRPFNCYTRFDHSTRKADSFFVGTESGVGECCFAPRRKGAAEGDGYLMGTSNRLLEGRTDLLIVDTQQLEAGPVATVKLPFRLNMGIHNLWVPDDAT